MIYVSINTLFPNDITLRPLSVWISPLQIVDLFQVPIIGPFPKFSRLPVFVGLQAEMYEIKMAVFLREGPQQDCKIWSFEHMLYALHIQTWLYQHWCKENRVTISYVF